MNSPLAIDRSPATYSAAERRALAVEFTGEFRPLRKPPVLSDLEAAVGVAKEFANEIAESSADREIEPIPPVVELERASALGLTSLFVPRSHGGPEADYWTLARVIATIGAANSSVAQILIAQYSLGDVITDEGAQTIERTGAAFDKRVGGKRVTNLKRGGTQLGIDLGGPNQWFAYAVIDDVLRQLTGQPIIHDYKIGYKVFTHDNTQSIDSTKEVSKDWYGVDYAELFKPIWGIK